MNRVLSTTLTLFFCWYEAYGSVVEMSRDGGTALVMRVSMPVPACAWTSVGGRNFVKLQLDDAGISDPVGSPELPILRRRVAVPVGMSTNLQVECATVRTSVRRLAGRAALIAPRQAPRGKTRTMDAGSDFAMDPLAYAGTTPIPNSVAVLADMAGGESRALKLLEIAPVQYIPAEGVLLLHTGITVRIAFEPSSAGTARAEWLPGARDEGRQPLGVNTSAGRLLVVAHDSVLPELERFQRFKQSLGWSVDLFGTSLAGSTTNTLKPFISARYAQPATRPTALLLVGDVEHIQPFVGRAASDVPVTDLYYACMDGLDDWIPEFPVGRFSASDVLGVADLVTKTIRCEAGTPTGSWATRAVLVAGLDHADMTESTHNWVYEEYMAAKGFTAERMYRSSSNALSQALRTVVNAGCSLISFSGHGTATTWRDGPYFERSDVLSLLRTDYYPVVCSFACQTAQFGLSECFGETWTRASGRGGAAFVGASADTFWSEDDLFERRFFVGLFSGDRPGVGVALNRAKAAFLEYYGAGTMARRYHECYNLLGDPTLVHPGLPGRPVPPLTRIVSPLGGADFVEDTEVRFEGAFSDSEGGACREAEWSSSLDGTLSGTNLACLARLSPGVHDVTLRAVDSTGGTVAASISVQILADTQTNGLPDLWEARYWPAGGHASPDEDPDADGLVNLGEWIAGTDPTNAASSLQFAVSEVNVDGTVVLSWSSSSGRVYSIWCDERLPGDWTGQVVSGVAATPPRNVQVIPSAGSRSLFYRIKAGR